MLLYNARNQVLKLFAGKLLNHQTKRGNLGVGAETPAD